MTNHTITLRTRATGTNPATGRPKRAAGTGRLLGRTRFEGYYGPRVVVEWSNGVRTYHSEDLDNSNVAGLPVDLSAVPFVEGV